jgi:hypothetical protein
MKALLHFGECEHDGDLQRYLGDLRRSGARIISSEINCDAETGEVLIEVADDKVNAFKEAFAQTDSADFTHFR